MYKNQNVKLEVKDSKKVLTMTNSSFVIFGDMHLESDQSFLLLEHVLNHAASLMPTPSPVVFIGDMTNCGHHDLTTKLYNQLQSHDLTYRFVAGNHDFGNFGDRLRFTELFGPTNYTFELGDCTAIVLDTSNNSKCEKEWHGLVEPEALDWLSQTLKDIDQTKPLLLFAHAGLVGCEYDHTLDVQNAEEILKLLEPYNLKAIFHAHAHKLAYHQWNQTPVIFLPHFQHCPGYLHVLLTPDGIETTYRLITNHTIV